MSRADSPLRERMIFNVGARRSGTYWLQRIVTAHPEVSAVPSETHLMSHGIAPLFDRFQHEERTSTRVGHIYVDRARLLDACRDLCDVVFGEFLDRDASRVAERTPLHALHLSLIFELYPDARFVHIIRDGRDVARSIAAQHWGTAQIARAAEEWRSTVTAARYAGLPDDRYREIRYEELLAHPGEVVSALFGWLELPWSPEIRQLVMREVAREENLDRARSPAGTGKWRGDFSASDLAAFNRVAGRLLVELGYEFEAAGEPAEPGGGAPAPRARRSALPLRRLLRRARPSRFG